MSGVARRGVGRACLVFQVPLLSLVVVMAVSTPGVAQTAPASQAGSSVEALLKSFQDAAPGSELEIQKALEISQNYDARLRVKQGGFEQLGGRYYDVMKGSPGQPGFLDHVIVKAQARLDGKYPPDVLSDLRLIQNEASRAARSAPMDADIGLWLDPAELPEEVRRDPAAVKKLAGEKRLAWRKRLGGPAAVARFQADLQRALEDSYKEVARQVGVNVDLAMVFLTGTTPWHAEAYLADVLKQGGVPPPHLIQQTIDVPMYKVHHLRNLFLEATEQGRALPTWAVREIARGTLKDLEKVEAVFDHVGSLTGKRPAWTSLQESTVRVLRELAEGRGDPLEIIRAPRFGGIHGFTEACTNLFRAMEDAVVAVNPPLPQVLKARLYARYLSPDVQQAALGALADDNLSALPPAARDLDDKLTRVMRQRLVTLEATSADEFLTRLQRDMPDLPFRPGDTAIQAILDNAETMPDRAVQVLVGEANAATFAATRQALPYETKLKLARQVRGRVPLGQLDARSARLAQRNLPVSRSGAPTRASLTPGRAPGTPDLGAGDVILGVATALAETAAVYDLGLSPDEERRRVMNAWATAVPVLGEFSSAIIIGSEALADWSTDWLQATDAVVYLAIGVASVVPGGQVAAVVLSLGMLGKAAFGSWWAAQHDKELIQAWLDSGEWDRTQGRLLGLHDALGRTRAVDPPGAAFEDLYTNGEAAYHTGLTGQAVRASLLAFVERTYLTGDQRLRDRVGATELAIRNLYPEFKPREALREPMKVGRVALATHIKAKGDNPQRSPAMALYVQLERVFEEVVAAAIAELKSEAEAEYQARFLVGEAKTVLDDLAALELRLHLPLTAHVNEIEESFLAFTAEWIKAQWDRHSLPVRRVERARQYVKGYSEAEQTLGRIGQLFAKAGVPPPGDYHLSGYLPIDGPRLSSLEQAYTAAIATAGKDALELARLAELKGDLTHPCIADLYRRLAQARIYITAFNDQRLLFAEWSGRAEAAREHRDIALQRTLDRVALNDPVPIVLWRDLSEAFESELAWSRGAWGAEQVFREGAARYAQVSRELQQSITEREMQYSDLRIRGRQMLVECATKSAEPVSPAQPAARPPGQAASPREACVQSARSALESARAEFERVKTIETWRLEAAQPFVCGPDPWIPCMSDTHRAVFKEVDGRDPINQWKQAEAPGCSFVSMKSTEYNRCAWQQYLKRLEVLTERRIQACEAK